MASGIGYEDDPEDIEFPFPDGTNPESVDVDDEEPIEDLEEEQLDEINIVFDDDEEVLADNLNWDE